MTDKRNASSRPEVQSRKLRIEQIELPAHIGIHPHELENTQPLMIDLELDIGLDIFPRQDQIKEVVDYQHIVEKVAQLVLKEHVQLIETLAEHIGALLFEDPRIIGAKINLRKPQALKRALSAGCELVIHRAAGGKGLA